MRLGGGKKSFTCRTTGLFRCAQFVLCGTIASCSRTSSACCRVALPLFDAGHNDSRSALVVSQWRAVKQAAQVRTLQARERGRGRRHKREPGRDHCVTVSPDCKLKMPPKTNDFFLLVSCSLHQLLWASREIIVLPRPFPLFVRSARVACVRERKSSSIHL